MSPKAEKQQRLSPAQVPRCPDAQVVYFKSEMTPEGSCLGQNGSITEIWLGHQDVHINDSTHHC